MQSLCMYVLYALQNCWTNFDEIFKHIFISKNVILWSLVAVVYVWLWLTYTDTHIQRYIHTHAPTLIHTVIIYTQRQLYESLWSEWACCKWCVPILCHEYEAADVTVAIDFLFDTNINLASREQNREYILVLHIQIDVGLFPL